MKKLLKSLTFLGILFTTVLSVHAEMDCRVEASTHSPWNETMPRTGILTIGGETFTVTQKGCFGIGVEDDADAEVTGNATDGYVIRPSAGLKDVTVVLGQDVDPSKVTLVLDASVERVVAKGAQIKIMRGEHDIANFLALPPADSAGRIDLTQATVKPEIVKEPLDPKKGGAFNVVNGEPVITTAPTRPGLAYTLREGYKLEQMVNGDSMIGDGKAWAPSIRAKGGKSGFYSISVGREAKPVEEVIQPDPEVIHPDPDQKPNPDSEPEDKPGEKPGDEPEEGIPDPKTAKYCVIDLSGGTSATDYPVSYLDDVPSGEWTDEYKTNKLVLRRIPAGTFMMGSPTSELGHDDRETQHQVTLTKDFWIGVFEVTQKQWELVMGTRPSMFNNSTCYASRPVEKVSYNMIRGESLGSGWPGSSAVDSTSFIGKLRSKVSSFQLDLPTEAQWEYACRAGTTTALNSGKNLTGTISCANMAEVGRYYYNGGEYYSQSCTTGSGTAKVGSYKPNAWGLYDMHGNVREWCLDWSEPYSGSPETDPVGVTSGDFRIIRGGSYEIVSYVCRSAQSGGFTPSTGSSNCGLRLAAFSIVP